MSMGFINAMLNSSFMKEYDVWKHIINSSNYPSAIYIPKREKLKGYQKGKKRGKK